MSALASRTHAQPTRNALAAARAQTQDAILDGGYALPMRPTDFSHVLFVARLGQQYRWGGLLTEAQVWRHSCTKPALFKSSVARVRALTACVAARTCARLQL